jgi:DNA-binding MarR family transcriptional regulator
MNNLVKKGYVLRTRSEKDRRVVLISLTDKGKRAYMRHVRFHLEMVRAMREGLDEEQCHVLIQAMQNLRDHFTTL